jgi:hypothetical protein
VADAVAFTVANPAFSAYILISPYLFPAVPVAVAFPKERIDLPVALAVPCKE